MDIAAVQAAHPMLTSPIPREEREAHDQLLRTVDESASELERVARNLRAAHIKYRRRLRATSYGELPDAR